MRRRPFCPSPLLHANSQRVRLAPFLSELSPQQCRWRSSHLGHETPFVVTRRTGPRTGFLISADYDYATAQSTTRVARPAISSPSFPPRYRRGTAEAFPPYTLPRLQRLDRSTRASAQPAWAECRPRFTRR